MLYAKPGKIPRVWVSAERGDGGVQIVVRDEGVGFDPKYSELIFQPFKRLGRGEENAGTGIGLAITRKVVHALDDTVVAESAVGEGATFTVTLPSSPIPPAPDA